MESQITPTDAELSARVRAGDRDAFGELWRRHADSAFIVARQYRGIADPQDIVQEASRRVLNAILRGGGPFGDFRPYMNQTVRNVAVSWSRQHGADPMGDANDFAEQAVGADSPDHADGALDRMMTVRAFKSLPKRWQTVLWYTYVEGMGSDEAADHLGLSRNAAAALIGRAREGLRQAWLKAHVAGDELPMECRQVVDLLPSLERNDISPRQRAKVEEHLESCARCSMIAAEVNDLAMQLPILLLPLVVAGFDVLTTDVTELLAYDPARAVGQIAQPSAAHTALPPRPTGPKPKTPRHGITPGRIWLLAAVVAGGVAAAVVIANLGGDTEAGRPSPDVVGQPSISAGPTQDPVEDSAVIAMPDVEASVEPSAGPTPTPSPSPTRRPPRATPTPAPSTDGGGSGAVPAPAPPVPGPIVVPNPGVTPPAATSVTWLGPPFTFTGSGVAGATVELIAGGNVVATGTVAGDGTWTITPTSVLLYGSDAADFTVRQVTADGVSAEVAAGRYTFAASGTPFIGGGLGSVSVVFAGPTGNVIEASVDDGPVQSAAIAGGAATFGYSGLTPGTHRIAVQYVNGAQHGITVIYSFVVT